MTVKRFKFSDAADDILIEAVKENGGRNIKGAMEKASDILEISSDSCTKRWYNATMKKYKRIVEEETKTVKLPSPEVVRETLDNFFDVLLQIKDKNKALEKQVAEQTKQLDEQARTIRNIESERKELSESYTYILEVIERARKMFLEEDDKKLGFK